MTTDTAKAFLEWICAIAILCLTALLVVGTVGFCVAIIRFTFQ